MNWFRFYHDALDDPKVQRLDAELFKSWINLLCLASKADERGCLPPIEDIAFALRVDESRAVAIVEQLTQRDLIDSDTECARQMHNWNGRQRVSDDVAARVRKHRESETIQTENAVTLQVTDTKRDSNVPSRAQDRTDTDTDTEQNREREATRVAARQSKSKRASRIADDFSITEPMRAWAHQHQFSDAEIERELEKFVNYWQGSGKTKLDWNATWRTWMLNAQDRAPTVSVSKNGSARAIEPKIAPKAAFHLVHEGERN
jgi:hypothetical protein